MIKTLLKNLLHTVIVTVIVPSFLASKGSFIIIIKKIIGQVVNINNFYTDFYFYLFTYLYNFCIYIVSNISRFTGLKQKNAKMYQI